MPSFKSLLLLATATSLPVISGCLSSVSFAQTPLASPFLEQVKAHYEAWDGDHDGALSVNEIELAVHDPAMKGPAGAAAAALRISVRYFGIKSLTLSEIQAALPYRANATPKTPNYEKTYDLALKKIETTKRELFPSGKPNIDTLGQGRLGDCFLLAGLGTCAFDQPDRLKQMMVPQPDGKVAVTFGTGQRLVLDPPTDAEVVIGASTRNDGMWAIMFEKAIGQMYLANQKTPRHVTPLSIIGVGGSPHTPMQYITGHALKRVGCEGFQGTDLTPEARAAKLAEVRAELVTARKAGRMIVGGTAPLHGKNTKHTIVPGLYYNHSYGVLDFDEATDIVTFWNPFGNSYKPKGEPGLKNGYPTSFGRFKMPLTEAVMWFGSFSIETDKPFTG